MRKNCKIYQVKTKERALLIEMEALEERWAEYFEELLNVDEER